MKKIYLFLCLFAALFVDGLRRRAGLQTANSESSAGTHEMGIITRLAAAGFATRYLFVQAGADDDHVALCDGAHPAVGYTDDMPMYAEDAINVALPGAIRGTRKVISAAPLPEYADIYLAANGQVQAEPAVVGSYYKAGKTVRASVVSADGTYVAEAVLHPPNKMVVLAHTAAFADLAAALSTPATVKVLTS